MALYFWCGRLTYFIELLFGFLREKSKPPSPYKYCPRKSNIKKKKQNKFLWYNVSSLNINYSKRFIFKKKKVNRNLYIQWNQIKHDSNFLCANKNVTLFIFIKYLIIYNTNY